jgi:transposase
VSDRHDPAPLPDGLDLAAADWQQTPLHVRLLVLALLKRLDALESRVHQNSSNSSRPPSTDAPTTKRQRRKHAAEQRQPGGQPGHPGHPPMLLAPTATVALCPEVCACGFPGFADVTPYHTHQVIELPVIRPEVMHWTLHQGRCRSCGRLCKATVPTEQVSGYGPRLTAFIGEMAGIVGTSRSAVQDLCASVFGIPLSKGVIQKLVDRVSAAILPHYTAIGEVACTASVNYIDETSWLTHGDRGWL